MSQYRDDLEAAHERIRALEREVADLRLTGEGEQPATPAGPLIRPTAGRGGAALVAVGVVLLAGLLLVALATRRPAVFLLVPPSLVLFVALILLGRLVHVVLPSELLVLAGRRHRLPNGGEVGFRVISSGRVLAMPFIERLYRMDLRARCLDLTVKGPARDSVGVTARATLLFTVDAEQPAAAIERFLEQEEQELDAVARETLEGCLRAAMVTESLQGMQADPMRFRHLCLEEAEQEFRKLGLRVLDIYLLSVRGATGQDAGGQGGVS